MGSSSSDIWFTGRAAQSNVWFGVLSQLRHTQYQKLLRKQSCFGVCPGRDAAFCSENSPTTLEDSGDGFPAQTDCDTLRFLQSVSSCQVRQGGTGSEKRLRIVTAMLRQVFCGVQGATLAFVTTATMYVAMCDIADVLRAYANSQNGDWLSADSISRTFWIRTSLKPCSVSLILWPR